MAEGAFVVLALVLAVAVPLVLWSLIESETEDTQVLDRESAERSARADAHVPAGGDARRESHDPRRSDDDRRQ